MEWRHRALGRNSGNPLGRPCSIDTAEQLPALNCPIPGRTNGPQRTPSPSPSVIAAASFSSPGAASHGAGQFWSSRRAALTRDRTRDGAGAAGCG